MNLKILDDKGKKYNRLTIIDLAPRDKKGRKRYICKCDCGNICEIDAWKLKHNWSKSCGCYQKEKAIKNLIDCDLIHNNHNLSKTDLYNKYYSIKRRCYNKKQKSYKNYGGRGIVMCEEWKNDFVNFYNWSINNGYKYGLEIDRINNNGNYEPNNCRFVTHKDNCCNKRNNVIIEYNGEKHCLKDWCKILNKCSSSVGKKIKKGQDKIEALLKTKVYRNEK